MPILRIGSAGERTLLDQSTNYYGRGIQDTTCSTALVYSAWIMARKHFFIFWIVYFLCWWCSGVRGLRVEAGVGGSVVVYVLFVGSLAA